MKKWCSFIFIFFLSQQFLAQDEMVVRIGIHDNSIVRSAQITLNDGQYELKNGNTVLAQV